MPQQSFPTIRASDNPSVCLSHGFEKKTALIRGAELAKRAWRVCLSGGMFIAHNSCSRERYGFLSIWGHVYGPIPGSQKPPCQLGLKACEDRKQDEPCHSTSGEPQNSDRVEISLRGRSAKIRLHGFHPLNQFFLCQRKTSRTKQCVDKNRKVWEGARFRESKRRVAHGV